MRTTIALTLTAMLVAAGAACHRQARPQMFVRNDTRFALCDVTFDNASQAKAFGDGRVIPSGAKSAVERDPASSSSSPSTAIKAKPCDGGREVCATTMRLRRANADADTGQEEVVFREEGCKKPPHEELMPLELRNKIDEALCSVKLQVGDDPHRDLITIIDPKHKTARLESGRGGVLMIDSSEAPRVRAVVATTCRDDTHPACSFPMKVTTMEPSVTFDDAVCPPAMRAGPSAQIH